MHSIFCINYKCVYVKESINEEIYKNFNVIFVFFTNFIIYSQVRCS